MRGPRSFLVLYLLSGCAALLYEVLWVREVALALGNTATTIGLFLATFMAGLAGGSWGAGRWVARVPPRVALRQYAVLEVVIALSAILVPTAFSLCLPLWAAVYDDASTSLLFAAVRIAGCAAIVAIPTLAMGASYPLAVRWMDRRADLPAGLSYAVNTVGATIGALLAGFVLLPTVGRSGTTLVGVGLNLFAAVGAWALSLHGDDLAPVRAPLPHQRAHTPVVAPREARWLVLAAIAISGAVSLTYEVAWTRALALVLGPTTYAFSAMLVAFVGGLGVGAMVVSRVGARRLSHPVRALGLAMASASVCALGASWALDRLPLYMASVAGRPDATFGLVLGWQVALAVGTLLPLATALGTTLPLAIAAVGTDEVAYAPRVFAVNTLGALAGSIGASVLLIPWLGLEWSIRLAAAVAAVTGGALVWARRRDGRVPWHLAVVVATLVAAVWLPRWNHARLSGGGYRLSPRLAAGDIQTALEAGDLRYYREGSAGTVSVRQLLGVTSLAIDGKVDASDGADMTTQALLAHLPLLLHEQPRSALVVGLGSGVTAGAALRHPIERLDIAELSPEVVEASHAFDAVNGRPLSDRRSRLLVADGRAHLQLTRARYDVIVSEPSNPWMSGVAPLFTQEFLRAARAHLAPGGILCQWAHTYNLDTSDVRSIVGTFLSVFPEGSLWLVGSSDLLLIGSPEPIRTLDVGFARAWARPGVAPDLARAGVDRAFVLSSLFVGSGTDLRAFVGEAPVQRDARAALEFTAPRALYGQYLRTNADRLREVARSATHRPAAIARDWSAATASDWRLRAELDLRVDAPDAAFAHFQQSLDLGGDADVADGLVRAATDTGTLGIAEQILQARVNRAPDAASLRALSRAAAAQGRPDEAAQLAQRAATQAPRDRRTLEWFIDTLAATNNGPALTQLADLLSTSGPGDPTAMYARLAVATVAQDPARVQTIAQELTAVRPADPDVWNVLGRARLALGDHAGAAAAFNTALRLAPRNVSVLANIGSAELALDRLDQASAHFSSALVLQPTFAPALDGLATTFERQGRSDRARALRGAAHP